jgi:phenylpropionate dioxygenase-like ring-hydroxylating dioxygenase large terminal subunit
MEQTKLPGVIGAYHAALERFWHPVLPAESLSDAPVGIELLGRGLALARLDGEVAAFDDVCRHLGAALSIGEVVGEGCFLRCAYHGWSYDKTGCRDYVTPTGIRLVKESAAGTYVIWQVACPVSHDRSLIFSRQTRSFDRGEARDPEYERLQDTILEQDRPIVESQRPWLLPPLSSRIMLYARPADLPLFAFQKRPEEPHTLQEV